MSSRRKQTTVRRKAGGRSAKRGAERYWSARVTRESDALDLERKVFSQASPRRIAASLKRSAERSRRRKGTPFRSAMSMLTFYINRAGNNLPARRRAVLERAKDELRAAFGRA
jgi:putative cell wall-binding protein